MPIRESFDYTFCDHREIMLALEAREDQSLALKLLTASGQVVALYPTRKQWLEFRATLNHILDAEDVTASSAVAAKDSAAAEQKATFERWLDKQCLDDTDFNDPPEAAT